MRYLDPYFYGGRGLFDPDWCNQYGLRQVRTEYGGVARSYEAEFYVSWSVGQGGNTEWAIVATMIDMDVTVVSGKCSTAILGDCLNKEFYDLLVKKGWAKAQE